MNERDLQHRVIAALGSVGILAIENRVVMHRGRPTGLGTGSPDLVVLTGGRAGFIEMKTLGKGSKLSPEQAEWHRIAAMHGHRVHIARSVEQAVAAAIAIRALE